MKVLKSLEEIESAGLSPEVRDAAHGVLKNLIDAYAQHGEVYDPEPTTATSSSSRAARATRKSRRRSATTCARLSTRAAASRMAVSSRPRSTTTSLESAGLWLIRRHSTQRFAFAWSRSAARRLHDERGGQASSRQS
jgi:hypothetical protein